MPLLGALISALAGGLASLLSLLFGARIAIRIAGAAALTTLWGVLMLAFNGAVAPLAAQIFATPYGWVLGLAFPPISGSCMAAYLLVWSACSLYSVNRRAVQMAAGA